MDRDMLMRIREDYFFTKARECIIIRTMAEAIAENMSEKERAIEHWYNREGWKNQSSEPDEIEYLSVEKICEHIYKHWSEGRIRNEFMSRFFPNENRRKKYLLF